MQPFAYLGNADYRGWLNADPNKRWALDYVGNDGGINQGRLNQDFNFQGNPGMGVAFGSAGNQVGSKLADLQGYYSEFNRARTGGGNVLSANTGAANGDPNTAAYYTDQARQLQGQLGNLDAQQNVGLSNIGNSYNLQSNRLNEQKGVAQRNYDTSVQQNTRNYLNTRNGVMQNTRATANALQRLLGMAGSGSSSAATEQAPYAAALQGSQNLNAAQQTFGNNASSIDTNWQDTERSFKNSHEDLDRQKYSQENSLRASIAQTRASLLDKIGQANVNRGMALGQNFATANAARTPYQQQIDSLLSQITQLGSQFASPVLQTGDVRFNAPDVAQYSLGQNDGPSAQAGAPGDVNPTFLGLLTGRRDERGRLIA